MENENKLTIIKQWLGTGSINIFGRQFAGKDTHGRELVALFDGILLGAGDIFRNSIIPQHAKDEMDAGRLVPTRDFIEIILPYLSRDEFKNTPLILSAVGRWHGEEEGVLQATETAGHPIKAVIYLDISESVARERWGKSRAVGERDHRLDETKESLETRLKEYREKTIPVIEFYRDMGLLIEVNGTLNNEVVLDNIINTLYSFATNQR